MPARAKAEPADRLNKIPKETLRNRVYTELRRALMSGSFEPGQAMVVRVLAEEMNAGLMPVREAMQQLVNEGGLELLPHHSVRVPVLQPDDLKEIYKIRVMLESLAGELAAKRITPEELAKLEKLAPKAGATRGTAIDSQVADLSFHFTIYEAARAPHLLTMIERLWLKVGPLLTKPYRLRKTEAQGFFTTAPLHQELLEALRKKNSKEAGKLVGRIINHALDWHLDHSFE